MIDCETLGTPASSVILSIALMPFELTEEAPAIGDFVVYYPDVLEQKEMGRFIDVETMDWWSKQPMEAREWLPYLEGKEKFHTIHEIFKGLSDRIDNRTKCWARGTDFDFPLISSYISGYRLGLGLPWAYGNVRDVRTIADEMPLIRKRPGDLNLVKHRAYDDCLGQVWSLWERWPTLG